MYKNQPLLELETLVFFLKVRSKNAQKLKNIDRPKLLKDEWFFSMHRISKGYFIKKRKLYILKIIKYFTENSQWPFCYSVILSVQNISRQQSIPKEVCIISIFIKFGWQCRFKDRYKYEIAGDKLCGRNSFGQTIR